MNPRQRTYYKYRANSSSVKLEDKKSDKLRTAICPFSYGKGAFSFAIKINRGVILCR